MVTVDFYLGQGFRWFKSTPSAADPRSSNGMIHLLFCSFAVLQFYILGSSKLQVSCLTINADYNKKSHVCHNVCHGIDWQNWRQKPGFINKKFNKTTLFMHKIEYITCNQRLILLFQTDIDISGSRFKFDRGKAS